eukprot:6403664-Amphidinium_carterae.1
MEEGTQGYSRAHQPARKLQQHQGERPSVNDKSQKCVCMQRHAQQNRQLYAFVACIFPRVRLTKVSVD